jgi:hypothetical protein
VAVRSFTQRVSSQVVTVCSKIAKQRTEIINVYAVGEQVSSAKSNIIAYRLSTLNVMDNSVLPFTVTKKSSYCITRDNKTDSFEKYSHI